jgi:outer membrane protein TolC
VAEVGERRTVATAGLDHATLDFDEGRYAALLTLDLPWERTAERNAFRESYIFLEEAVRGLQEAEDRIKFEVRDRLRELLESREEIQIQAQAIALAKRRVKSTNLFLQAGRAEIRDLLEAQESLLDAQNALTAAMIAYRLAELGLQRDMGLLRVDEKGLWQEFTPGKNQPTDEPTESDTRETTHDDA